MRRVRSDGHVHEKDRMAILTLRGLPGSLIPGHEFCGEIVEIGKDRIHSR